MPERDPAAARSEPGASRRASADRLLGGRPLAFLGVGVGGALGTAARAVLTARMPHLAGLPAATMTVNLVGAFLLGLLVAGLMRRGPDVGVRRFARLGLGAGFCGGLTTYSTLAYDTVLLLRHGAVGAGLGYALGTLLLGAVASWLGVRLAYATGGRSTGHGPAGGPS